MANENKTAIVFFSKDGTTKMGAELLNKRLNGKVIELKEAKKGNFIQAIFKKGSHLVDNPWYEITDVQQVYFMFPIWAGNGVPAMNTFLGKADFKGKEIIIITFQQFEDLRNSDKVHKYISDIITAKQGSIKGSHRLVGAKMGQCADEKFIKEQIDKIKLVNV
jgi:flavodoxin